MRLLLALLLAVGPFPGRAFAQWTDDGTVVRLTTSSDSVGVGTTNPATKVEVVSAAYGLKGRSTATSADYYGVGGEVANTAWYGYGGYFTGGYIGAYGESTISGTGGRYGLYGYASNGTTSNYGVYGYTPSAASNTAGVYGYGGNIGVWGKTPAGHYAGYFEGKLFASEDAYVYGIFVNGNQANNGNLYVGGTLSKAAGSFTIDHPLDPENKILQHSFVESPDMKNLYDGIAVLDAKGEAAVQLPDWFEALNKDFRYQLTPLGSAAPGLFIKQKIASGRFVIAGGRQGQEVSWLVTGTRHDPYALAHPIVVEQAKGEGNGFTKGRLLQAEARGKDREKDGDFPRGPKPPPPADDAKRPHAKD